MIEAVLITLAVLIVGFLGLLWYASDVRRINPECLEWEPEEVILRPASRGNYRYYLVGFTPNYRGIVVKPDSYSDASRYEVLTYWRAFRAYSKDIKEKQQEGKVKEFERTIIKPRPARELPTRQRA